MSWTISVTFLIPNTMRLRHSDGNEYVIEEVQDIIC